MNDGYESSRITNGNLIKLCLRVHHPRSALDYTIHSIYVQCVCVCNYVCFEFHGPVFSRFNLVAHIALHHIWSGKYCGAPDSWAYIVNYGRSKPIYPPEGCRSGVRDQWIWMRWLRADRHYMFTLCVCVYMLWIYGGHSLC